MTLTIGQFSYASEAHSMRSIDSKIEHNQGFRVELESHYCVARIVHVLVQESFCLEHFFIQPTRSI